MKSAVRSYAIDKSQIILHRFKARLLIIGVFFGLYLFFLAGSMLSGDNADEINITNYVFGGIFVFIVLVCLFFSSRAERAVIVITKDSVKRTVDGDTTHQIALDEIGELRDFSRGFLIIKKGHSIPQSFFLKSNFEHFDFQGIIYVPEIMNDYWIIHGFVRNALKTQGV
jgi:hypothetical protein